MEIVDLRSDTVTKPTPPMWEAMAKAEVGDDVYGEDPTVNRLQELAAVRMGKEAGLWVASGTMGNLAAILAHCNRGDEAIMGDLAHTVQFEGGGVAALGGVMPHTLPNQPDGTLKLDDIQAAIRPDDIHQPPTRLILLENTHNRCRGVALTAEYTRQAGEIARKNGLSFHLDGARIFNAATALGTTAQELVKPADSVTFCLSKGLCAPVGSVLCGSRTFIEKARRMRKMLGGGMRQAGMLAAAGIVAIEEMPALLVEDHRRARDLAEGLKAVPGITVENDPPATNMVFLTIEEAVRTDGGIIKSRLADYGVRVHQVAVRRFRLVTHYWVSDAGVDQAIEAFRKVVSVFL